MAIKMVSSSSGLSDANRSSLLAWLNDWAWNEAYDSDNDSMCAMVQWPGRTGRIVAGMPAVCALLVSFPAKLCFSWAKSCVNCPGSGGWGGGSKWATSLLCRVVLFKAGGCGMTEKDADAAFGPAWPRHARLCQCSRYHVCA
jgi:hypothetical protein